MTSPSPCATSAQPSEDHSPRASDQKRQPNSTSHRAPIQPASHAHAPSAEQLPRPEHCTGTAAHSPSKAASDALSPLRLAWHASLLLTTASKPHSIAAQKTR